jgi:hypothetical protein
VNQADHARFAADLLALIRLPELVEHPRRADLLRAVAEHDNGWWESDAAPRFEPTTRLPVDFRAVADEERREIWRRGVERFAAVDPYRAAMIAGHALRLFGRHRRSGAAWGEFLAGLEERRAELAAETGLGEAELRADDGWLELADELALAAATGDAAFVGRGELRLEATAAEGETRFALRPFPFAGATTLELACRYLPLPAALAEPELARALAQARWERRRVRVVPLA